MRPAGPIVHRCDRACATLPLNNKARSETILNFTAEHDAPLPRRHLAGAPSASLAAEAASRRSGGSYSALVAMHQLEATCEAVVVGWSTACCIGRAGVGAPLWSGEREAKLGSDLRSARFEKREAEGTERGNRLRQVLGRRRRVSLGAGHPRAVQPGLGRL